MRMGQKGRVVARVAVVVAIAAAVIAGVAVLGDVTQQLAEITWADPGPRQRADDVERFGPFQFVAEKRGADLA